MKKNKEKLMEEIWITYHPKLQVYLKQLFPGIYDTEERASEILMKIFDKLDSYNPKYALSTWIYMIARHSQIDEIRKKTLKVVNIDDHDIEESITPEKLYLEKEMKELLHNSIESLKPFEKEVVFLYYYEELKIREISKITGTPEGTIKYRLAQTREKIKNDLNQKEVI